MEILMAILVGISLSAACGFRVFVPMLVMSLAARTGWISPGPGFEWIGSNTALTAFAIATVCEIAAYYIPVVDNFLDAAGIPIAAVAGTFLTASLVSDMSPLLQWGLAIITGGGSATAVHSGLASLRAAVTPVTAGIGNPFMSTLELMGSGVLSLLAVFLPILAFLATACIIILALLALKKFLNKTGRLLAR